ncbi:MAG TPA: sigma-70 family RNA polymerase sigma factor [Phycisphaerales bacterium]|nr:sigma-70 family RNA polymerase sigma factor [Phycisphaerales bacterium]HMP36871.1 sigma-70 family RNA polymerase sigma factor [Phycisphaerales bacterium]
MVPHATCSSPDSAIADGLLAQLRAGDDAAFEALVRRCSPRLLATARRLLGSEAEAHDAVQDAFLSAFRSISSFGGESSLETWLHRVLINAALMRLRKSRRHRGATVSLDELLPQFDATGHRLDPRPRGAGWSGAEERGGSPEQIFMDRDRRDLVRRRIDMLPAQYRTVIMLRDIEELGTDETAAFLGITPGAVKVRLHRARMALRTLLERDFA